MNDRFLKLLDRPSDSKTSLPLNSLPLLIIIYYTCIQYLKRQQAINTSFWKVHISLNFFKLPTSYPYPNLSKSNQSSNRSWLVVEKVTRTTNEVDSTNRRTTAAVDVILLRDVRHHRRRRKFVSPSWRTNATSKRVVGNAIRPRKIFLVSWRGTNRFGVGSAMIVTRPGVCSCIQKTRKK